MTHTAEHAAQVEAGGAVGAAEQPATRQVAAGKWATRQVAAGQMAPGKPAAGERAEGQVAAGKRAEGKQVAAACGPCGVDRRAVLMGAGAVGVAGLLASCGADDPAATVSQSPSGGIGNRSDSSGGSAPEQVTSPSATADAPAGGGDMEAAGLVSAADVPVGGGIVIDSESVVVTQPTAGQFMAFSSICTHQGCSVADVADGLITCPCHGSQYSAADGSVHRGPAQAPLSEIAILVEGDQIVLEGSS